MGRRYVVSGENRLRIFETGSTQEIRSAYIGGAGALCAGSGRIFCAGENVIWSLDAETLTPRAVFAAGPQVCDLHISRDGQRLYVLCGGADSVLMLDAGNGAPQLLARAGVNPPRMALSSGGDVLAVAGGASGRVILLDAMSLAHIRDIHMPGPVQDVIAGKLVHALCYGEGMESLLVSADRGGKRMTRALSGLPGALLLDGGTAFAAAHGRIDRFDPDAPHRRGRMLHAPGRVGRMILLDDRLIYTDVYAHTAFSLNLKSGMPEKICGGALEAAAL